MELGDGTMADAAWPLKSPCDEQAALEDRMAFDNEKLGAMQLRTD